MDKSVFMALWYSATYTKGQEESGPPVYWILGINTLIPSVKLAPAPLCHGPGPLEALP